MFKFIVLLILASSIGVSASELQLDQIDIEGRACEGLTAQVVTQGGQYQLVVRFKDLKARLTPQMRAASSECVFAIPFKTSAHRSFRFFDPMIKGAAELPARIDAQTSFEFAWPGHRGPNFVVGYRSSSRAVKESFQDVGQGTELQFACGEMSKLVGTVAAQLNPSWLYKGSLAQIEVQEVRLNIQETICHN